MKQSQILLMLALSCLSSLALASFDGCDLWCGEFPNAYFLTPGNDTRGNLGLLLEDQALIHYAPKTIPFHYAEFMASPNAGETEEVTQPAPSWATDLGLDPEGMRQALQRLKGDRFGRCRSDNLEAIQAFAQAVKKAELPGEDSQWLLGERLRLAGLCEKSLEGHPSLPVSGSAEPFARYLDAVAHFYAGQYDQAMAAFQSLAAVEDPWLRETSLYLQGRVALNQAQIHFDQWSGEVTAGQIDKVALDQATAFFKGYLKAYPQGLYAASAQGLFRKIHWLSADPAVLTADYQAWLAKMGAGIDPQDVLNFINETESKANPVNASLDTLWASPVLASLRILSAWRPTESPPASSPASPMGLEAPRTHRADFATAGQEALLAYLGLAHALWVTKDYPGIIRETASDTLTDKPSNLRYSRWVLRGLALMARQQWQEAENHWQAGVRTLPHPGQKRQAQWLLALTWDQSSHLDRVYAEDSPVAVGEIRDYFIHRAKPALLEDLLKREDVPIHTRSLAYFRLVKQWLLHRQFKATARILSTYSVTDFSLEHDTLTPLSWGGQPGGYVCPSLKELITSLQSAPDSAHAQNCLGDFLRTQSWDTPTAVIADENNADDGRHRWHSLADYGLPFKDREDSGFDAKTYSSLDYYQDVINRRSKTPADDMAYALHRATHCFASSSNNHCGSQEIPKTQRAAWFKRLKTEFRDDRWAVYQKYYW
ncbi:Tetratricopeptide repeat protein [Gammaproteobacteria bacterium]